MPSAIEARLGELLEKYAARPDTSQVRFALAQPRTGWSFSFGDSRAPYFLASITKLFTTAIVLQLVDEGKVALDAPLGACLPHDLVAGLHLLDGVDRSEQITVRQLLSHTSGLADYFEQPQRDGSTTIGKLLEADFGWTLGDVLETTKSRLRPAFMPGEPGEALYSDTNYQLLGAIIEAVGGTTYAEALGARIFGRLGIADSYLFSPDTIDRYDSIAPMLYGSREIRIPLAMASTQADGGIVSSAADSLRFLRAFMAGELFAAGHLAQLQQDWRTIFYPLRYGTGLMLFELPRYHTNTLALPSMIGHSGASGSVLFHVPELDLHIAGTVNQVKKRSLVYRLLAQIVAEVGKR